MRKFVAVLFVLLCSTPLIYGQKTRFGQTPEKPDPADYAIKVHISATHLRNICIQPGASVTCSIGLYADAVLNGKKLELSGVMVTFQKARVLVVPGDYPAKLTIDGQNPDTAWFGQEYDLLLPDGTIWHCYTAGISE